MDFWNKSGDELIHKHPDKAKAFFEKLGSEEGMSEINKYIAHKRLAYLWKDSDKLFQTLVKNRLGKKKTINILEIGTFLGQGSKFFIKAFESIGIDPIIDCVDLAYPYIEETSTMNYGVQGFHLLKNTEEERMDHKIVLHTGRSRDIVPYMLKDFDLVYVDGEHTSGGVFMDLVLSFNKSTEDTVIVVDDLEWASKKNPVAQGVSKFVEHYEDHIKEIYLRGSKDEKYGLFKVDSYSESKEYKFDQVVFIVKEKTDKTLDEIRKEIKKYKLHLDPKQNPEDSKKGGRRKTRRNKRSVK